MRERKKEREGGRKEADILPHLSHFHRAVCTAHVREERGRNVMMLFIVTVQKKKKERKKRKHFCIS